MPKGAEAAEQTTNDTDRYINNHDSTRIEYHGTDNLHSSFCVTWLAILWKYPSLSLPEICIQRTLRNNK